MKHHASPAFWALYEALPSPIRHQADAAYARLKVDPSYPGLHFKRVGRFWSARVGLEFRVLGVDHPDGISWFWIGNHAEYDRLIR